MCNFKSHFFKPGMWKSTVEAIRPFIWFCNSKLHDTVMTLSFWEKKMHVPVE